MPIRLLLGVIAATAALGCAEARMVAKCSTFEPSIQFTVSDAEITTDNYGGTKTRARIIKKGRSENDEGMRYFRRQDWSSDHQTCGAM